MPFFNLLLHNYGKFYCSQLLFCISHRCSHFEWILLVKVFDSNNRIVPCIDNGSVLTITIHLLLLLLTRHFTQQQLLSAANSTDRPQLTTTALFSIVSTITWRYSLTRHRQLLLSLSILKTCQVRVQTRPVAAGNGQSFTDWLFRPFDSLISSRVSTTTTTTTFCRHDCYSKQVIHYQLVL